MISPDKVREIAVASSNKKGTAVGPKAGPRLDALVAGKVMGFRLFPKLELAATAKAIRNEGGTKLPLPPTLFWGRGKREIVQIFPHYSSNDWMALEVMKRLKRGRFNVHLMDGYDNDGWSFSVQTEEISYRSRDYMNDIMARGSTIALAICRGALKVAEADML